MLTDHQQHLTLIDDRCDCRLLMDLLPLLRPQLPHSNITAMDFASS
jgi:hypothetical protein